MDQGSACVSIQRGMCDVVKVIRTDQAFDSIDDFIRADLDRPLLGRPSQAPPPRVESIQREPRQRERDGEAEREADEERSLCAEFRRPQEPRQSERFDRVEEPVWKGRRADAWSHPCCCCYSLRHLP